MLVERPGEVVTREDLCRRLWPADTFADFDVGLTRAIKKLRYDEAIKEGRKAIELDPNHYNPPVGLGNIYVKMGKLPHAIAEHEKAVELSGLRGRLATSRSMRLSSGTPPDAAARLPVTLHAALPPRLTSSWPVAWLPRCNPEPP
jgi:tetratricopeptide (TPR) repeat protein